MISSEFLDKIKYEMLGSEISSVEDFLNQNNISYEIQSTQGKKDSDILICEKVINIKEKNGSLIVYTTYFSDYI